MRLAHIILLLAASLAFIACGDESHDPEWGPGISNGGMDDVEIYPMRSTLPGNSFEGTVEMIPCPPTKAGEEALQAEVLALRTAEHDFILTADGQWQFDQPSIVIDGKGYLFTVGNTETFGGTAYQIQTSATESYYEIEVTSIER